MKNLHYRRPTLYTMSVNCLMSLVAVLAIASCARQSHRIEWNADGEPIVDPSLYTLNGKLSPADFKVIDTASLYIETFEGLESNEGQRANPMIYRFHSDGYYKTDSYLYFGKFDKVRNKDSAYYGGRYSLEGNAILLESFYSMRGGGTKRHSRVIHRGIVKDGTITITFFGTTHKFVKRSYNQVFN